MAGSTGFCSTFAELVGRMANMDPTKFLPAAQTQTLGEQTDLFGKSWTVDSLE